LQPLKSLIQGLQRIILNLYKKTSNQWHLLERFVKKVV